ncbi:MAG: hypothetical protein ABSB32_15330 [Thermodesulfobacteriota bacterium]
MGAEIYMGKSIRIAAQDQGLIPSDSSGSAQRRRGTQRGTSTDKGLQPRSA